MELKTPLYETHVALGGKIVPFAGYLLPVQYSGVIEEHMAVREKAGLFDVSHMGELLISGKDALNNINNLFTNSFNSMTDGRVRYSPMCNEHGGVVDDLVVYRMNENEYFIVFNAANHDKDVKWMGEHLFGDVTMKDLSEETAQIALQGPASKEILAKLALPESIPTKYYTFVNNATVANINCLVSRTGYTGEFGYEIYCKPGDVTALWNALLEAGKENGLIPCGLGARDTLRMEAAMPLYGHEMSEDITPLETGLDFAVKMDKENFIGKAALFEKGEPKIKRIGLKITGRGIARENCPIYIGERMIGQTTSGTHCPFLNGAYAMALVDSDAATTGTAVECEVRSRKIEAEIIDLPFIKK